MQITLPIAALLPESYVPDVGLRLQLYRRMARLRTEAEIEDMRRELKTALGRCRRTRWTCCSSCG